MICSAILCFVVLLGSAAATDRPIIGVLSQEIPSQIIEHYPGKSSLISASYIKAIEASGARVAPIFINQSLEYYRDILSAVNGVVFPGGGVNFTAPQGYAEAGKTIVTMSEQLKFAGEHFPILGVCLGFELLMFIAAGNSYSILEPCDARNIALPLEFRRGFHNSRLFNHAPSDVIEILRTLPVTSNHHRKCVTEKTMKEFQLKKLWRVLSTNHDSSNLTFVSSVESFHFPIVGIQFHPEKNAYEWSPEQDNPHFRKAVYSARYFYDWVVTSSKGNNHSFPSLEAENDALIYNYNPVFTGKDHGYNEQIYVF